MFASTHEKTIVIALAVTIAFALLLIPAPSIDAADHLDGGGLRNSQFDPLTDITDVWTFLDPNDNNRLELILGVRPFIIPGENESSAYFDQNVQYRFNIENTGDKRPDVFIDVTFSQQTSRSIPQTATVKITGGGKNISFTAPTTIVSGEPGPAPSRNISTNSANNIKFFAGLADDPFFFDVPAEIQFRKSLVSGRGDPALFTRGRDTFAGYNILTIVISVPVATLRGSAGNIIGVSAATFRPKKTLRNADGSDKNSGSFVQVDAMGIPVINVVLIPLSRKDEYNAKTPDNSAFANDIVGSLRTLGTDQTSIGILGQVVVDKGDFLRIDTTKRNTGSEGGNNVEAGFPNGRRLLDDVTDTIVTLIFNRVEQPDGLEKNDKLFLNDFPWVAEPNQPLQRGEQDTTQN
jgi:hypothetical protein